MGLLFSPQKFFCPPPIYRLCSSRCAAHPHAHKLCAAPYSRVQVSLAGGSWGKLCGEWEEECPLGSIETKELSYGCPRARGSVTCTARCLSLARRAEIHTVSLSSGGEASVRILASLRRATRVPALSTPLKTTQPEHDNACEGKLLCCCSLLLPSFKGGGRVCTLLSLQSVEEKGGRSSVGHR